MLVSPGSTRQSALPLRRDPLRQLDELTHPALMPVWTLQFFHEGLKSWSCCKDINKPVMEFDAFTKIKVCPPRLDVVREPSSPTGRPSVG